MTFIRAKYVLAGAGEQRHWLRNACVRVDGDAIAEILTQPPNGAAVLDLGDAVLLPGLIDLDALVDIDHLILDSWHAPADALLLAGSQDYWQNHRRDILTPAQRDILRTYGAVQLALHGITSFMPIASEVHLAWNEHVEELHHLAETASALGLRAWLGPSYRSAVAASAQSSNGTVDRVLVSNPGLGEQGLADATDFADSIAAQGDPLITPVMLPCRIETLTPELMKLTAAAATERDLLVRLHSLQQPWERALIQQTYDCTPLDLLEQTGLLGDRLLIPHALWTDRNPELGGAETTADRSPDLARIRTAGASVVHCPLTSFRYGSVLHTLADYQRVGVNVALGTDSFPPDLIRGIDVGFHAAKALYGPAAATLSGYLDAATTGGARALRRPDLGRIEVGATADLVAFSLADIRDGVHEDPLRTLTFNASGRNAEWSMVAGRVVLENGVLPGVDIESLRRQAQDVFDTLRAGYVERDAQHRAVDQLFPPTYPYGD